MAAKGGRRLMELLEKYKFVLLVLLAGILLLLLPTFEGGDGTGGSQKEGAVDEGRTTVVVSKGSGREEAVPLQQIYPQFQGALVVCPGGSDPEVRLKLVEAVSALTGLGSDKISICKGK